MTTTVANLSAAHFGHIIACNGWQGRLAAAPWRATREAAHADWCAEMRRAES